MLHNHLDMFKKRENIVEIEEGKLLSPKFDNDGLIPVITMCSKTRDILMHGYMNVEAFKKTIETKEAHYFSRSRKQIWHKGKTSGFTQKVTEIRIDDDQDSVWLTVDIGDGSSCHVGYRSCFYRSIPLGQIENGREVEMKFEEKEKSFDPEVVYKGLCRQLLGQKIFLFLQISFQLLYHFRFDQVEWIYKNKIYNLHDSLNHHQYQQLTRLSPDHHQF